MLMVVVKCGWCSAEFEIREAEVKRQFKYNGRTIFYCSRGCSTRASNHSRGFGVYEKVIKICPYCDAEFETIAGKKGATFCSRSCASAGSVTEKRIAGARKAGRKTAKINFGINGTSKAMKKREAWRYKELDSFLNFQNEPHEFEYVIGNYLYDLALTEKKLIIEFDEEHHNNPRQRNLDARKDKLAVENGWRIDRVLSVSNKVIKPESLYSYFR